MTDEGDDPDELAERVADLHETLRATEELPVDREASRWLGEAQAVAADVATGGVDEAVVRERVERVDELLAHVDGTGHEEADDVVDDAREITEEILSGGG